jgi:hypothetical protein
VVQTNNNFKLVVKSIDIKPSIISDSDDYKEDSKSYQINNCGTLIKATSLFIVLSCPTANKNKGKISLIKRSDFTLYKEIESNIKNVS